MISSSPLIYATFWQRLVSRFIDVLIIALFGIILVSLGIFKKDDLDIIVLFTFYFFYYPILECYGGTIGKKAMGIKPLKIKTGNNPSILSCYIRSIFLILPMLLLVVVIITPLKQFLYIFAGIFGFMLFLIPLPMLWTKKKQGLHDLISGIIVVKK